MSIAVAQPDRFGLFRNARGDPQPVLKPLSGWENTAARLCDQLGLSPTARVRLGVTRAGEDGYAAFLAAVREAAQYGLYDLDRLERMILRRVARDYFLLLEKDSDPHD